MKMQSLSQRLRTAQPFTAVRPTVPLRVAPARSPQQSQQACVIVRAADATLDLSEYAGEVDVSTSAASLPMASENVRLRIRMRGYDVNLLAEAVEQIRAIAETTGSAFKGPVMLPTRRRMYTVLRSPHVNKDSREQFEVRTHHR